MTTKTNIYRTDVPGGPLADGSRVKPGIAFWWKPEELPPRRKRPLDIAGAEFADALHRMVAPREEDTLDAAGPETVEIDGQTVNLAQLKMAGRMGSDMAQVLELGDLTAWVYLKSWTLTREVVVEAREEDGISYPATKATVPLPVPESSDDLLDLPRATYEALLAASAKVYAEAKAKEGEFSVEGVEDPASPIGASGD